MVDEAHYYGEHAYDQELQILDSSEGWVSSAIDLLRFLIHVDGYHIKPDIIDVNSIGIMTSPSDVNPNPYNFAKGHLLTLINCLQHDLGIALVQGVSYYHTPLTFFDLNGTGSSTLSWKIVNGSNK